MKSRSEPWPLGCWAILGIMAATWAICWVLTLIDRLLERLSSGMLHAPIAGFIMVVVVFTLLCWSAEDGFRKEKKQ